MGRGHHTLGSRLALLAWVLALGMGRPSAHAQERAARELYGDLVPYDLDGERTYAALQRLGEEAARAADPKKVHALTFMRSVALTDLWLLAWAHGRDDVLAKVSTLIGLGKGPVRAVLDRSLASVDNDTVHAIVDDARTALAATDPEKPRAIEQLRDPRGPRTSALFIHAVARNANGGLGAMAKLSSDPCADPKGPCPKALAPFDDEGRRAASALGKVGGYINKLRAIDEDEPFVTAWASLLDRDAAAIARIELAPRPRIASAVDQAYVSSSGTGTTPEIAVLVDQGKVAFGFVPKVRLDAAFELELVARGEPKLPELKEIAIRDSFPIMLKAITEAVDAFSALHERAPDASIAVAAAPTVASHLWARVLLSARAAGFQKIAMLGFADDGTMRTVDVDVIPALKAEEVAPHELFVMVRLGGFTVRRVGPSVTIPRVRSGDSLTFDFDSLAENVGPPTESTQLTFMADVSAATLGKTVFTVAPKRHRLTVVLP